MEPTTRKRRPSHMNGTQVPGKEKLTCGECKRRGVGCGGVWRFHSQHEKYLLQCRTCRIKRRACPFRRFENDEEPQAGPRGGKRRRGQTPTSIISISDSDESDQEKRRPVAGPSSRPEKRVKSKGEDEWDKLKDALLVARKRKVEIETEAEIELAKINSIIQEAERDLKKAK